jgi:hypothetical protein
MDDCKSNASLLFANRCKSLPVFNSTCFWLTEYYNRVKDTNLITKYTMSIAETTIKTSICLAEPIMGKFKDQLQTLDSLACRQLDKLEAAFPILHEDTTKVVTEGKNFLTKTVQPAVSKINIIEDRCLAIRNYGLSKVSLMKYSDKSPAKTKKIVKKLLDASERFIETYFVEDHLYLDEKRIINNCCTATNDVNLGNRVRVLSCTLYCAVQRKCLRQVNVLINSLDAYLDRLNSLVNLLDRQNRYLKAQFKDKMNLTIQKMNFYKEYLQLLTMQMLVQDGRSLDHVHVSIDG